MASSKVSLVRSEASRRACRCFCRRRVGVVAGGGFDFGGEVEQVEQLVVGEVEILQEVGCGGFDDLFGANMVATEDASFECLFT